MYNEQDKQCILYDEDPADIAANGNESDSKLVASKGNLYRVLCSHDDKGKLKFLFKLKKTKFKYKFTLTTNTKFKFG